LNPRVAPSEASSHVRAIENGSYNTVAAGESPLDLSERAAATPSDLLLAVWRERRFVAKAGVLGLVAAAIVSLLIRPTYESTTRLMPPERGGLGGLAAMLATGGSDRDPTSSLVGGFVADAVGLKSSGALWVGVLKSDTVEDSIVKQFDLMKVYRTRFRSDARDRLAESTTVEEDRKTGIISITVADHSPQRAMQMARAYPETLGRLTAELDTSAAHRERVFLEERLKNVKQDMDSAAKALSEFSSKNLTLDVKEQGKAMVEGAAVIEGQLIAAESELGALQQIYTSNNVRVRTLQGRIDTLRSKLSELRKGDASNNLEPGTGDFGTSISSLPAIGVIYYDLLRQAKIQETVYEVLTKQLELAKIEEAKSVPTIKVLDNAQLPERKSSPKRTLMTLAGAIIAALFASIYVVAKAHWQTVSVSHPLGVLGLEMRAGLSEDAQRIRKRMPPFLWRMMSKMRFVQVKDDESSET
jgi:uncharacterized protein involved in exopolysaccharide biosynthesis